VRAGDVLYELRADDAARIPAALEAAQAAVRVGRTAPTPVPLVLDRVAAAPARGRMPSRRRT
jgi:thymidine phosphorylase